MASTATQFDTDCSLMLHMDGADASTTFTDSSFANTKTITANGNAQIDTARSKFGGASGLFDGSSAVLTIPTSTDFDLDGIWTLDLQVNLPDVTTSATMVLCSQRNDDNNRNIIQLLIGASDVLRVVTTVAGVQTIRTITTDLALSADTWTHLAIVKNGNDYYGFKDGTQIGTTLTETTAIAPVVGEFAIGARNSSGTYGNFFNGWMDEFRLVKGTAVWTANFTPPAAAYTRKSATSRKMMLMGIG